MCSLVSRSRVGERLKTESCPKSGTPAQPRSGGSTPTGVLTGKSKPRCLRTLAFAPYVVDELRYRGAFRRSCKTKHQKLIALSFCLSTDSSTVPMSQTHSFGI
jgi:hypothetical protein